MAGASQTQTGRRTDKYALSPFALLGQAVTSCGAVWYCLVRVVYSQRTAGFENNKMQFTRRELAFNFSSGKKNQQKNKHQLELTVSLLFFSEGSVRPGCKDSGAPGFGPDRPQQG